MLFKKLFIYIFKKIILLTGLFFIFVIVFCITYFKPYIKKVDVRYNDIPEIIKVVYVPNTCDPYFPRLYEINQESMKIIKRNELGLMLALPEGINSPEDTEFACADNTFLITCFRYKTIKKNYFTGKICEISSPRIDVVSWSVCTPYNVWVYKKGTSELILETKNIGVKYVKNNTNFTKTEFKLRKYSDCF